jgi:hypothetical protein
MYVKISASGQKIGNKPRNYPDLFLKYKKRCINFLSQCEYGEGYIHI